MSSNYPNSGEREAWQIILTALAGLCGAGNPARSERIARLTLALHGVPRTQEHAGRLIDIVVSASARVGRYRWQTMVGRTLEEFPGATLSSNGISADADFERYLSRLTDAEQVG